MGAPWFPGPTLSGYFPGAVKCPEPLRTLKGGDLSRRDIGHPVSGHYPAVIATTSSCASPQPSRRLRAMPGSAGPRRLLSAPAGRRTFPRLSLSILPHVSGPLPRRPSECTCSFLPPRRWPSPYQERIGGTHHPDSDFSRGSLSRLQSFRNVQTRGFASHPGRSYPRAFRTEQL
jgi:hypothetical protein